MKTLTAVLGFILFLSFAACGDRSVISIPEELDGAVTYVAPRKPVLNEKNCDSVWFRIDDVKSPGLIDASFDSDPIISGIQAKASAEYIYGRVPDGIRVVFLYKGDVVRTNKVADGKYSALLHITQKDDGEVALIQLYTYGWCRIPGFLPLVKF